MRRATFFIVCLIFGILCCGTTLALQAQQSTVPAGPIPTPISTGKIVFVANGGMETLPEGPEPYSGGSERAYNQFYDEIKKIGRFRLVKDPSDADFVIKIHLIAGSIPIEKALRPDYQLRASLIEPKTQTEMWTVTAHIDNANRQAARDQNFDKAMDYIVTQIKRLTEGP